MRPLGFGLVVCDYCECFCFFLNVSDEQLLHETSAVPEHTENLSATLISDLQMEEVSCFYLFHYIIKGDFFFNLFDDEIIKP